ncbi:universal stress protein family protein [Chitinophaga polysaccharea]|uniref:Universal stress protein family protein n=1 Tax=Chitinophaga polysaccharea TaxID=1293035 RepID=A0A561PVZ0_9BACT|nr:universal stress protein [Chitinophaga polysaccharea]TWF42293.1 universal stress protein family protein [Chitinophaga polysaccharea]
MKKVIAVIDILHFSDDQVRSFKYFARQTNSQLTVICLDNLTSGIVTMPASVFPEPSVIGYNQISVEARVALQWQISQNIKQLHQLCDDDDIDIIVKESVSSPVTEIVNASRYADLILVNNSTSFAALSDSNPPRFVKDILADAECPVMVLPDVPVPVKEIIFSYNGTYSSIYAIRQFTLLFPEYADTRVRVVYVTENDQAAIPFKKDLKAYLDAHYSHVDYAILNGEPATEFLALLIRRDDCIVTYGAFGRSGISRFFHRSDADSILRTTNIPVFVTHP